MVADVVTGGETCSRIRLELGVYLLGAIEPAQRALVDGHLVTCDSCRAELSDLAGLPSLLRRVPDDVIQQLAADGAVQVTPEQPSNALLARVAAARRRSRLLAVAAAVVVGIVSASAVHVLHGGAPRPPAAVTPPRALTVQAANPVTRTWAAVRYTAEPWGTELEVSITGPADDTWCQLLVTGPHGQVIRAGDWKYEQEQQPLWYLASVPIQAASLQRFAVVAHGKILVTIQAR